MTERTERERETQDRSGELRISSGRPILKKRGGEEGAQSGQTVVRTKIGEGRRMKEVRIGGGRRRERVAVNRREGAQPRQFHKGGKSGRFLKSVNFLRLSLSVSVALSLSLSFLDVEDVYGFS